jgi:uncharacterized cupin superfamily protein
MTFEEAKELAIKYANDFTLGIAMITKREGSDNYGVVITTPCIKWHLQYHRSEIIYIIDGGWKFVKTLTGSAYRQEPILIN